MEETLQLRDLLAILRRRMRFIVLFIVASMGAALLFLLVTKPEYEALATLKYNPAQFDISKDKQSVNSDLFDRLISGEIAAVGSPSVMLSAIKSENLLHDQELNKTTLRDLLSGLLEMFQLHAQPEINHELWVMERFKKRLRVTHPDRTNIISVSYRSEDPEKSARIANAVTSIFLAQHLDGNMSSMPLAAKWLSDRKAVLQERWRESQGQVERFKADHNLSYLSDDKLREQQVDRLNEQLMLASTRTEEARAKVEEVRQLLKSRDYQQLADIERSAVLARLRDRYAEASQREASLSSTLLPSHPTLGEVRAEIASLRTQIEDEGKRILDNLEVTFQSAQERERLIRNNFDKSITSIQNAGANIVKLKELQRKADTDREIYEAFLNRSNETMEQSTGQFANFRLIRKAQVPSDPSFPSKLKVLLLAAFGSLAASFGIAFIRETLVDTFRTKAHVRETLNLPVLTQLPELMTSNARNGAGRLDLARILGSGSPFSAGLRNLRRALSYTGEAPRAPRVVAVTSTLEGEGKTTVAAGLAQTAAQAGMKTLLVDGDWHQSDLGRMFRLQSRRANGSHRPPNRRNHVEQVVFTHPETGLDIVPAMAGAESSSHFARSGEFRTMLVSAREHYDFIVIDTPAVNTSADACSLADHADEVVFVIAWNRTSREKALLALQALQGCDARVRGIVLNKVDSLHLVQDPDAPLPEMAQAPIRKGMPPRGLEQPSGTYGATPPLG